MCNPMASDLLLLDITTHIILLYLPGVRPVFSDPEDVRVRTSDKIVRGLILHMCLHRTRRK